MFLGNTYLLDALKTCLIEWRKNLTIHAAKVEFRKLPHEKHIKYINLKSFSN